MIDNIRYKLYKINKEELKKCVGVAIGYIESETSIYCVKGQANGKEYIGFCGEKKESEYWMDVHKICWD